MLLLVAAAAVLLLLLLLLLQGYGARALSMGCETPSERIRTGALGFRV